MASILGMISFLLRLTLAIQSQVAVVLPSDYSEEKRCIETPAQDSLVYSLFDFSEANSEAFFEIEEEEKNETEIESLLGSFLSNGATGFSLQNKQYDNPFFGNKGLQGDLHLYDLFHSWKTPLS